MRKRAFIHSRVKRVATAVLSGSLLVLSMQCLDPYRAPGSLADVRSLVVDGFLNGTDHTCTILLSRSQTLEAYQNPPPETGAEVSLEDEGGASVLLGESDEGSYVGMNLPFQPGDKIKLKIKTRDRSAYESDMIELLKAPLIDSIAPGNERAGVPIYITSHNAREESSYYYWKYAETWSYTAKYETSYTLDENHLVVPLTENIYQCWNTATSKDILIGTSSTRVDDTGILNRFPLVIVPWNSAKLQYRYSILVEQRAISKATFDYLDELKKNTENLGTLFDPLPSAPAGNIHCITRPDEMVQGQFTASTVEKKRIYVNSSDLKRPEGIDPDTGYGGCMLVEIRMASDWFIFFPVWRGGNSPLRGTTKFCVDCRRNGGTNIQPDFWVW